MSRKDDKLQELVVTGREAEQVYWQSILHTCYANRQSTCSHQICRCPWQETSDGQASTSGLYEQESASQLPCILNGAMAGFSGGALGYVFGFGASTRSVF